MARIIDIVLAVAPNAAAPYREAFDKYGDDLFAKFGLTTSNRVAHFLARCLSETGDFITLVENPNYTAANLAGQWNKGNGRKQFISKAEMMSYAGKPEELFNRWYGNRMGNGGPASGDGFRMRGRGPLQMTGKAAYRKYGQRMGVDLVANPDLALDPRYILLPSFYEWDDGRLNRYADADDALSIARVINVGTVRTDQIPNGYKDQVAALRRVKAAIKRLGWASPGVAVDPATTPATPSAAAPDSTPTSDDATTINVDDGLSEGEIKAIQTLLRSKGIHRVGLIDGKWGKDTVGALAAFQSAAGLPVNVTVDRAWVDKTTIATLATSPQSEVGEERAKTTASDLRKAGDGVAKATWWTKLWAKVFGVPALALGVAQQTDTASGYIATAKSLLSDVPDKVWLIALVAVAGAIYLTANRAEKAAVANVRDGRDAGPA
ncbi:peptidoglycan-binding protein [Xanthobacter sp.]|uniref:peptidoglycan-binding protein n=1 Tax=Xanthobacter sp. TaxID=35809 RepID=UPI0025D23DD3|nr:peptidoglycan-binding protein [Xanthobacter sp.]